MIKAKHLESILSNLINNKDPKDIVQRFEKLAACELLPNEQDYNTKPLSNSQIIACLLSIIPNNPQHAGFCSKIVMDFYPVGGMKNSFQRSATLGKALETLFESNEIVSIINCVRISFCGLETSNSNYAVIEYEQDQSKKVTYFVEKTATSLLCEGTEKSFNTSELSPIISETILNKTFFKKIILEIQERSKYPEEKIITQQNISSKPKFTPDASFLNIGVDTQVSWPNKETEVKFGAYTLVLLPKTKEHTTSISINLHSHRIDTDKAITIINQFLSILTWCDNSNNFAIAQEGFSGSYTPAPIRKRFNIQPTAFHHWIFDRKIPTSIDAAKALALALYRQGRNAEQNFLVSFSMLSYYKIIEITKDKNTQKWIKKNWSKIELLAKFDKDLSDKINNINKLRGDKSVEDYLRISRNKVAHGFLSDPKTPVQNPDITIEIKQLHIISRIMREYAKLYIEQEFGISKCQFDGS